MLRTDRHQSSRGGQRRPRKRYDESELDSSLYAGDRLPVVLQVEPDDADQLDDPADREQYGIGGRQIRQRHRVTNERRSDYEQCEHSDPGADREESGTAECTDSVVAVKCHPVGEEADEYEDQSHSHQDLPAAEVREGKPPPGFTRHHRSPTIAYGPS